MSRKIQLAMDSSSPTLLVGVKCEDQLYSLRHSGIKQEQFFLPLMERALKKFDAKLTDINQLFFVRGPGRFTGIRISLTFASMLQTLNHTQIASATLFEILHKQAEESLSFAKWQEDYKKGVIAVVLHAFREEYFLQFFDEKRSEPQWLSKGELLQRLVAYDKPLYIVGTDKEGSSLSGLLGERYRLAPKADSHVRPQTLLKMLNNPIYKKNALEPLYLKPARFELGK